MVSPLSAVQAYAAVQNGVGAAGAADGDAAGSPFADMVKQAMNETIQTSRAAESQMGNMIQGKAELVDVVTAVASAEASLETMMAVRDQVISAYQEIMRMPI